jgi:hypothetical protein
MQTLLFYASALAMIFLTRIIGKKWHFGYFAGGLAFGIYNEICFEFCWTYSPLLKPMVWKHVPLLVILGWSIYTALALVLSDLIVKLTQGNNRWVRKGLDVAFFFAIGYPLEVIMSHLGLWKYNFPIQGELWMQMFGYFFVGILVSSAGRAFQRLLDTKR